MECASGHKATVLRTDHASWTCGTVVRVSTRVFITTSRFSPGALEYLRTVSARVITIDGARLVEQMIETGVGVRTRKVFERYRVNEDFLLED